MARSICSLACFQQFIAKFLRAFPKMAMIFLIVHVTMMIYSVMSPKPNTIKSGHNDVPLGVNDHGLPVIMARNLVGRLNESNTIHLPKNKTNNSLKQKSNKTEHGQFVKKLRKRKKDIQL